MIGVGRRRRSWPLTVYLLREHVRDCETALRRPGAVTPYALKPEVPFRGALFVRQKPTKTPWWMKFISEHLTDSLALPAGLNVSALLFVEAGSRVFVFTFGHGHQLLNPSCFVTDFGLRVALNTVNPDSLRSVDVQRVEELTIHTRRQTSRSSPLDTFGLDPSRDLLRAVTGEPRDPNIATRVTGRDALRFDSEVRLVDLAPKCEQLLAVYNSDSYKVRFAWIDHLKVVRDPVLRETLDGELLADIVTGTDRAYVAPPQPLDWEDFEGFRFSSQRSMQTTPDLDLEAYLRSIPDLSRLSLDLLKRHRVQILPRGLDSFVDICTVYESIVYETEREGIRYVHSGKEWFSVAGDFAAEVRKQALEVLTPSVFLPPALAGETEDRYNARLADADDRFVLLHKRSTRRRIEVCDLLSADRQFIHVKRKTRSSTLSHLFSQGAVSAEAFLLDTEFREDLRGHLQELRPSLSGLAPVERPLPRDYEVVYAVIAGLPKSGSPSLPFFSQLNLVQACRRLRDFEFRASFTWIQQQAC